MDICTKAISFRQEKNCTRILTDAAVIGIWFVTDEIVRIRTGFGMGYDVTDNWAVLAGYTYDWDPCRNKLGYAHSMLPVGDRHIVSSGVVPRGMFS